MKRSQVVPTLFIVLLALVAALVAIFWPAGRAKHHATCWSHPYADSHSRPGAPYIRRHGKGPLDVNVCDPKS